MPVKPPHVPDELSELNNIRKAASAEKYRHSCRDYQGVSYDC